MGEGVHEFIGAASGFGEARDNVGSCTSSNSLLVSRMRGLDAHGLRPGTLAGEERKVNMPVDREMES